MLAKFTHPKNDVEIQIIASNVLGWHYLESLNAHIIIGIGGGIVPVKEKESVIKERILNAQKEKHTD